MRSGESLTLCELDGVQWSVFYSGALPDGRHRLDLHVGSDAAGWVSPVAVYLQKAPQNEREVRQRVADAVQAVADAIEEGA